MKIENYKGIDIFHNAEKDEFHTNIVILKGSNGKKDEYISSYRLQKTRDEIDKFLNTASKKPVVKKAWYRKYDTDKLKLVDVQLYNFISDSIMIKDVDGRNVVIDLKSSYSRDKQLYIQCKENDATVTALNKKIDEISKMRTEENCIKSKLILMDAKHFK